MSKKEQNPALELVKDTVEMSSTGLRLGKKSASLVRNVCSKRFVVNALAITGSFAIVGTMAENANIAHENDVDKGIFMIFGNAVADIYTETSKKTYENGSALWRPLKATGKGIIDKTEKVVEWGMDLAA